MVLVTRDGLTVRELAEAMGVSPGWASRLADELVESGFVIRERDGADRRIVRLRLAPEARAQIDEVGRQRAEAVARALEGVPAANRAVLATLLDRISSEFERLASLERGRSSGSTRG
jgi:DNA-binding MarR family transcriptional regulator